jgi:putative RecB family exonuclease
MQYVTYPVPTSLSPSRVESFTSCPMAFRFASIERLPEPPGPHATKGSLVHRVLEILYTYPAALRLEPAVVQSFHQAVHEYDSDPEFVMLGLDDAQRQAFADDAWSLVQSYLRMEDPTLVNPIGVELRLEAQVGDLTLRGIIDRLDLDQQGQLIVTDYKTGRAPGIKYEQSKLGGVHFYSFLCESVLGQRPAAIRLMYLRTGEIITATPSSQSTRFITTRTTAVWKAVERACTTGDFRPRPGRLCSSCAFHDWCPAFGGDPDKAAVEAPLAYGRLVAA